MDHLRRLALEYFFDESCKLLKLTLWTAYNYTKNDRNLFAYNKVDVGREIINGFTYTIDRLNTISFQ